MRVNKGLIAAALGLTLLAQTAAAEEPVLLRLSYFLPPSHPLQISFKEWAANVEKASGGSIKTVIFPAEQLGKAFDHYDMARDGIADVALVGPGYQPGRFPIAGAADLPFLYNDGKRGTAAIDAWYRKYAPAEMKEVHFCVGFIQEPAAYFSRRRTVMPEDMKGQKVRSPGAVMANFVTDLGGTNVSAPPQQSRELIERGVADGTFASQGSAMLFGIDKVARYHIDAKINAWFGVVVINMAKYDGLSAQQKAAIDQNCSTEAAVRLATPWADFEVAGRERLMQQRDQETISLTADQLAAWRAAAEPLMAGWADQVRKVGVDPDKALAELRASLQQNAAAF